MDTLSTLRSYKLSLAANSPQTTGDSTAMEVKALKAQVRLAQLEETKLRSQIKQLEGQVKQFEDLPAQLAALKAVVEQQERTAAKATSLEDVVRRLGALEKPNPIVENTQLAQLQSDVQALKMDVKKLDLIPEQIEQLQSTATQHGNDIAQAVVKSSRLRTDVDSLSTLKEDVNALREQRQAMRGDAVKVMIQTAIQPEIKKMDTFRIENEKLFQEMHMTVQTNKKLCDDLDKRNLPAELQGLHTKIDQVESNESKMYNKVTTLQGDVRDLRKDKSDIYQDIKEYIGPIHEAYSNTSKTILQRAEYLEDGLRSTRKEQDHLSSEHEKLSSKTDKHLVDSVAFKELQDVVCSHGEDTEKLVQDVSQMKLLINELKPHMGLANEHKKLVERVRKLQAALKPTATSEQIASDNVVDLAPISSMVASIQQELRSLEDHIRGDTGLDTIINSLQEDVEKMEVDMHTYKNDLDVLQSSFADLFAKNFDPFKASIEARLKLQKESTPPALTASQQQLLNNVAQDIITIKQDLSRLQETVDSEMAQRNSAIEQLTTQVALKQDIVSATQANDTIKAAVRNLQNQYDNISTDDLHQKMVHWFVQQYPSNAANLAQQYHNMQHEVGQLRKFSDQINRIPNGPQVLGALAQKGPQLIALVQSPLGSRDTPETRTRTSEALKTTNEAVAKAQKQNENMEKTVGGLQTFMQTLNSNDTPFVRTALLATLEQSIRTLRADLTTKISNEHNERVTAQQSIEIARNRRFQEVENGTNDKIEAISERVESLQTTLGKLRTDFDEVLNDSLTPINTNFLNRLPSLFIVIAQMQELFESLNLNLPKGPLDFEWYWDLNSLSVPEGDKPLGVARKGVSRK